MPFTLPFTYESTRRLRGSVQPPYGLNLVPEAAPPAPQVPPVIPFGGVMADTPSGTTREVRPFVSPGSLELQTQQGERTPRGTPTAVTSPTAIPTPTPVPAAEREILPGRMPAEDFTGHPEFSYINENPAMRQALTGPAGIVEPPPVRSEPVAGVAEVGIAEEEPLVGYRVIGDSGEPRWEQIPESLARELDRSLGRFGEPRRPDLDWTGAAGHLMAPLDAWADLVADAFSQVPKLARGDFGALETPTLIAEGFVAAVEDFHERPLAQQIMLAIITDPLVLAKLVTVGARLTMTGARVATKAPLVRLLKAEIAQAASTAPGGEQVPRKLIDQIADDIANRMVKTSATGDTKKVIVLKESQPKPSPEVAQALLDSAAFDAIDMPRSTGNFLSQLPVIKKIRGELWGTRLSPSIRHAWLAAGGTEAKMRTAQATSRAPVLKELGRVFGTSVLRGGKSDTLTYIGPKRLVSGIEGSLLDIAQRPHFYNLNAVKGATEALAMWQVHQSTFQRQLIDRYGVRVGEWIPHKGGVFLSNVNKADELLDILGQTVDQAIRDGRNRRRLFETASDRMRSNTEFDPVLDMVKLQEGMDAARAGTAGREVFKQGIGGLTRAEVIAEVGGPAAKKQFDELSTTIGNLLGRLEQSTAGAGITRYLSRGLPKQSGEELSQIFLRWRGKDGLRGRILDSPESIGMEFDSLVERVDEILGLAVDLSRHGRLAKVDKDGISKLIEDVGATRLAHDPKTLEGRDTGAYRFVEDGIYRWFQGDDLRNVRGLAEHHKNWLTSAVNFLDSARAGVFAGDVSPIVGVQLPLGAMFRPLNAVNRLVGAGKASIQSRDLLHTFRQDTMAKVILENPDAARDFSFYTGIPLDLTSPREFSIGFLAKIPKVGKPMALANERMFAVVTRQMFDSYNLTLRELAGRGVTGNAAKTLAADISTKIYPAWNPARLGLSKESASILRAMPTSISFIVQPTALLASATTGLAKIMVAGTSDIATLGRFGLTAKTLTEQERIAVKLTLQMAGSIMGLSTSSAAVTALMQGNDPVAAILDVMNPTSGRFASIVIPLPNGKKYYIPLGGPIRGVVKGLAPRETDWSNGVPVPFANLPGYVMNRINPVVAGQWDLKGNQDFEGGTIRSGNALHQVLDTLMYELEVVTPLTLGTALAGVRQGKDVADIATEVGGQFGGVDVRELTPFQARDEAVIKWAAENGIKPDKTYQINWKGETIVVDQIKKIDGFYDLQPADQKRFEEHDPETIRAIERETERRANQAGKDAEGRLLKEGPMRPYVQRVTSKQFERDMVRHQTEDDEKFANGDMGGKEWRDRGSKRNARIMSHRLGVYGTNLNEPEDVMDYFYAKIREAAGVDPENEKGELQWPDIMGEEEWEEVFDWVGQQSEEVQEYIDRNSGLKTLTPAREDLKKAQEYLNNTFWSQRDHVLNNPENFNIDPKHVLIYKRMLKLTPRMQKDNTTYLTGDSAATARTKESTRQIVNGIDRVIDRHLNNILYANTPISKQIQKLLLKYGYKITKKLIQLEALEEANR